MEEELLCGVCRDRYKAGKREPVVLPSCGHAFCRNCLAKLEKDSAELMSCFSCPTCRAPHENPPVSSLPPVFALLNLAESCGKAQPQTEDERKCEFHGSSMDFWCSECHVVLCGHCLLEGHVKEGHDVQATQDFVNNQRHHLQVTGARLKWEMDQRQRKLLREMAGLVTRLVCIAHQSQVLHDLGNRLARIQEEAAQTTTIEGMVLAVTMMGSLESEMRVTLSKEASQAKQMLLRCRSCTEATKSCPAAVPRQKSVSESDWEEAAVKTHTGQEDSGVTNDPPTVGGEETVLAETNISLCQEEVASESGLSEDGYYGLSGEENEGEILEELPVTCKEWTCPVQCRVTVCDGRKGRLSWENGRVHAYALTSEDVASHLHLQLPFLRSLRLDTQPEVFLDVGTEEHLLGRVYIKLWRHLRRAHLFLSLCMGTYGPSYRGSKFHGVAKKGSMGETLAGGRYLTDNRGASVQSLVEGLEWEGQYMRKKMAGLVVAARAATPEQDALFHICTRDDPGRKFACAFGEVSSGMEVVHSAVALIPSRSVKIIDCGLVLPRLSRARGSSDSQP